MNSSEKLGRFHGRCEECKAYVDGNWEPVDWWAWRHVDMEPGHEVKVWKHGDQAGARVYR